MSTIIDLPFRLPCFIATKANRLKTKRYKYNFISISFARQILEFQDGQSVYLVYDISDIEPAYANIFYDDHFTERGRELLKLASSLETTLMDLSFLQGFLFYFQP